jgi:hypothetical protein
MTNKAFERLMERCADAYNRYKPLLDKAEAEYERRYGHNPSDNDNDQWIDSFHGTGGGAHAMTIEQVEESARSCGWKGEPHE